MVLNILTGGIYHDPRFFDEPETFNPDRFLRSEFGTRPGADNTGRRHDMLFGSGRVCIASYYSGV